MTGIINESRFYMWRAVVAMIHADGVVTPHELSFIKDYMSDLNLTPNQTLLLEMDIAKPQLVHDMFSEISELQDRKDFFALARALAWCDGDFDAQEEHILNHLEKNHDMMECQRLLSDSRDLMNEVELCGHQWHFKTPKTANLFGFLNRKQTAS